MIDLDDVREDYDAAIAEAAAFARRARAGLPPDRWASTAQLPRVALGIEALMQINALQLGYLRALCPPQEVDGER